MPKTELYLSRIIKYGLYAILLTPLAFWPRALYAFGTPKFILFQVLVEIVFAAWLLRSILKKFSRTDLGKTSNFFCRNYIALAILGFLAVSFISAIFGIDFQRSFWGIGARMTGLFAELHFLAWFLMLVSVFGRGLTFKRTSDVPGINKNLRTSDVHIPHISAIFYLNFSFFVALAVAATGFYKNAEWAMGWGSTVFNNPTFAAPYLIFHFFWGLYQTFKRGLTQNETQNNAEKFQRQSASSPRISAIIKRWFYGAGSAFILFVILLGQVRGAILGLFAGILLLGLFLIFSDVTRRRFKIALSIVFILLFVGIFSLWIFRDSQFIQSQNVSILGRLTQFSLSQETAQTRFLTWRIALKGFGDRPLFGVGPENFNYLFNAHYNPRLLKFGGGGFAETWFDKPHNAFLEVLAETGIIGSLAYLLIWFSVAFYLFKLFKHNQTNTSIIPIMEAKLLSFILASAFVAYLGSVFFAFDSFGSWFGLFLFLAFLASRGSNTNDTNEHTNNTNKTLKNFPFRNLFVTFVLIGIFVLEYFNYGIWRANIADADALRIFPRDPAQGIVLFKKSLSYSTLYKSEYQFDLIASVAGAIEKGMPLPDLEDTVNFALGEADKAVAAHPKDAAKYTDMIRIYNVLGTKGRDPEILAQAEAFGNKSLKLSPQRQETLYYLARTALLKGDSGLAVKLTKNAVDAEPSVNLSHWYFGLALIGNSQKQEGIAEIKKAMELDYGPKNQNETDFIKSLGL